MSEFKKYDTGKPCFDFLAEFPDALGMVNKVMEHGAIKYGKDNWKSCKEPQRYLNAAVRHQMAMYKEELDPDSGLPHWAHVICNCLYYNSVVKNSNTFMGIEIEPYQYEFKFNITGPGATNYENK